MISAHIENLIIRYLSRQTTAKELDILHQWIKDKNNQVVFKDYIKTHYAITLTVNEIDLEILKQDLVNRIKLNQKKRKIHKLYQWLRYASVFVILLVVNYQYQARHDGRQDHINKPVTQENEAIILRLSDGSIKRISEEATLKIKDASGLVIVNQKENQLEYNHETETTSLLYNTLVVPFGKRFNIRLSDGTLVHLNAGSSLKYPVKFLNGKKRQVFLEGEAFFEVKEDLEHQFLVKTAHFNVKVYGTKFNVKSYAVDKLQNVVLVEGAVSMDVSKPSKGHFIKNEMLLKPGNIGVYHVNNNNILTKNADITMHTSWINGNLIFRDAPFKAIINTLERQYNVSITNKNNTVGEIKFSANFNLDTENINDVMYYFSKIYHIKYEVIENKITIY